MERIHRGDCSPTTAMLRTTPPVWLASPSHHRPTVPAGRGLGSGKNRCYVNFFTYDVIFFTYDVIFFT